MKDHSKKIHIGRIYKIKKRSLSSLIHTEYIIPLKECSDSQYGTCFVVVRIMDNVQDVFSADAMHEDYELVE